MNYNFSTKRANEINANNDLAKEEALIMKTSFKKQGNEKHSREMTHIFNQAIINDKMFELVLEEYYKL
jgi:hypothetical protein